MNRLARESRKGSDKIEGALSRLQEPQDSLGLGQVRPGFSERAEHVGFKEPSSTRASAFRLAGSHGVPLYIRCFVWNRFGVPGDGESHGTCGKGQRKFRALARSPRTEAG